MRGALLAGVFFFSLEPKKVLAWQQQVLIYYIYYIRELIKFINSYKYALSIYQILSILQKVNI